MWKGIGRTMVVLWALALPLAVIGRPGTSQNSAGGWLQGWANRIQLTIDHTKVGSALSNFPVLVHLSTSSGTNSADLSSVFSTLGSDDNRKKIAITAADGVTELYAEIEDWDTASKEAWLWVNVPSISSTEDTVLYLYYDPAQADNTDWVGDTGSTPAQKVWNSSYVGVWHLNQSGNTTAGSFADSTAGHHTGTQGGRNGGPSQVPSIIGDGPAFDGSNYITIPDSTVFSISTTGELTISAWVSPSVLNFASSADSYINFMGKGDIGQYEWSFVFYNKDGTDRSQRISFYMNNLEGGLGDGSYTQDPIPLNSWVYITAKVDAGDTYVYRNGALAGQDPYTGPDAYVEVQPQHGTAPLRIGTRNLDGMFQGRIDEVRISDVARSDAWVQASYFSEKDSLISFKTDEPPALQPIGDKSVIAGQPISFVVAALAPAGRPLVYSASNLPSGAEFDPSTHTFSWTPDVSEVGTYANIGFEVSSGGLTDSEKVTLTVVSPEKATRTGGAFPPFGLPPVSPYLAFISALILTAAALPLVTLAVMSRRHRAQRSASGPKEKNNPGAG